MTPPTRQTLLARFLVLLLVLASPALFGADAILTGRVLDAATRSALRGAAISVSGSDGRTVTDANGEFSLTLPAGRITLTVDYLGLPSKSVAVDARAGESTRLDLTLGDDTVSLAALRVEATRTGQARALNQQRGATNLLNVVSSDFTGQFPDKTIADAVKRLPGVTVETDRDTGGAEGRYITVRGMSADFNAVTIDGVRVNVTDFDGITRRVPLDVVSSDTADQIEVTKALRPDQDGDSIGGAVNIRTRSAFSRAERTATFRAALGHSALLEDYVGYPYGNPGHEAAVTFSDVLGSARAWGLALGANIRSRAFVKQRNSTTGWNNTAGYRPGTTTAVTPLRGYLMDSYVLQHYFDDIDTSGLNASLEWRPGADHRLRLSASRNVRETQRGRQRQQLFFPLARASDGSVGGIVGTPVVTGSTYTSVAASGNTVRREVRDFDEEQATTVLALDGESRFGETTVDYLVGYNFATWDGGLPTALQAQFQNAGFITSYTTTPGDVRFPQVGAVQTTTGTDRNAPAIAGVYTMRSLVRGSREYEDDELNAAINLRRPLTLAGLPGFLKAGAKVRSRTRDFDSTQRSYNQNNSWSLLGYTGQSDIGPAIADYRAEGTSDGRYDYGYFLDPAKVRSISDTLISRGLLVPLTTNDFNSRYDDYSATEDIVAGYAMGQFARGPLTALAGVRVERTETTFESYRVVDGTPSAIAPAQRYTDVLPGLHLRYDLSKTVVARAAYTESLARPTFNQLNPRETRSTTSDTVSRGNIALQPVYSRNFDAGIERYFGSVGYVSAGIFHKQYRNNVYRSTRTEIFEGEPTRITEPRNARGGRLTGVELAVDRRLDFLPPPLDGLGVTFNYTWTDSELDSGLPQLAGLKMPLFDQMDESVNASLYYEKGRFRARASLHRRSATLFELATDNPIDLARYEAPSTSLDVTASIRLAKGWTVFVEFANLGNEPSWGYNGDSSVRLDYNEYTDWSAVGGLRWSL
jgi:TonB-dependent receptor